MKYLWIVLSLLSMTSTVWADDDDDTRPQDKSPLGCKNVGYSYQLNTVRIHPAQAGEKQSLYFFYNKLGEPLRLSQMLGDKTESHVFLNHTIPSNSWAVLATGQDELKYICSTPDNKKTLGKIVSCQNSVKVCEFARVKFGLNNKGNFWVVNGNTRGGAVAEVVHYGIIPQ